MKNVSLETPLNTFSETAQPPAQIFYCRL